VASPTIERVVVYGVFVVVAVFAVSVALVFFPVREVFVVFEVFVAVAVLAVLTVFVVFEALILFARFAVRARRCISSLVFALL